MLGAIRRACEDCTPLVSPKRLGVHVHGDQHSAPIFGVDRADAYGTPVKGGVGSFFACGEETIAVKVDGGHCPPMLPLSEIGVFEGVSFVVHTGGYFRVYA